MFDLIRCKADPKRFGFLRFYSFDESKLKIERFKDVVAASQMRNRKVLAMIDDYKFDVGAIKLIAEKKKMCFLIDLSRIIKSYRVKRAIEISKLRSFLKLCNKYGALYALASFAEKEEEIRSPQELMHIAMLFDINKGQAKFALRMLEGYL